MTKLKLEQVLMDADAVRRALRRMARQIVELNGGMKGLAIVGIHTGGVHLAHRLCNLMAEDENATPPQGNIDITLYRDDVFIGLPQPVVGRTEMAFDVTGSRVVLVDDVLFSGRTVRSALDAVIDYGRPDSIRLAVLVDRGHRELPIQADVTGNQITTQTHHSVKVELIEEGFAEDRVVLYAKEASP